MRKHPFVRDMLKYSRKPAAHVAMADVYDAYCEWALERAIEPLSRYALSHVLINEGLQISPRWVAPHKKVMRSVLGVTLNPRGSGPVCTRCTRPVGRGTIPTIISVHGHFGSFDYILCSSCKNEWLDDYCMREWLGLPEKLPEID